MPDVALVMPKMSMTMTDGEVLVWHCSAGDSVRAGDVVAEVMTDKVDMEVESPADGVLERIVAEVGARVPVGEPMAFISAQGEDLLGDLFAKPAEVVAPPAATAPRAVPPSRRSAIPALPGARRRAGELGVSLDDLRGAGTGPSGAVSVADVEARAAAPSPPKPTGMPKQAATPNPAVTPPSAAVPPEPAAFADALDARRAQVRRTVTAVMTASAAIPQFTVWRTLDLDAADRVRGRVSWTAILVSAFARALHDVLNQAEVSVALAADTPVGLLAPVVRQAARDSTEALDSTIRDLVDRARAGRLTAQDLSGATTTFSNLGRWDVSRFTALLTPPQSTALSVGAVSQRPIARRGALAVQLGCEVGLTVDHTQADGADAARVLERMNHLLQTEAI